MWILKQLIGILATGYIFFFHSEMMFWARVRPDDSLQGWVSTWLIYLVSMPAGFILLVISLVKLWGRKPSLGGFVESADME